MPTLLTLSVSDYKLYPGTKKTPGLHIDFSAGPWVVLGVNGLGKSTLLFLVRSLLAGPFWVSEAGPAGSQRNDIITLDRSTLASRVSDGAQDAQATITVGFGKRQIIITRKLSNLQIVKCTSGRKVVGEGTESESEYRQIITDLMGVGNFADALRTFRYLIFVLEERDGLIWDPRAQAEIFRAVFMSPERSAKWRELEGKIISADSTARNINSSLLKIIQKQEREQQKALTAPQVRARLAALAGEQDRDESLELEMLRQRDAMEDKRLDARDSLRLREQEAEERKRDYERLKYQALTQALSDISLSDRYVFLTILSERICPSCGHEVETLAEELENRRRSGRCLVCGNQKYKATELVPPQEFSEARAQQAYDKSVLAIDATIDAQQVLATAESAYSELAVKLATLRRTLDERSREMRVLQRKLPADERRGGRDFDEIAALRRRVLEYRAERDAAESELEELLTEARASVEAVKNKIERKFRERAQHFLLEGFRLVYAPDRRTIGQTGRQLEFPAFEVELAGGALDGQSVRRSAQQVSHSQREYLDWAFRMAVMDVVSSSSSTLVIDGPEGSVDAVFAIRAGELLAAYSEEGTGAGNRLLVACNLVDTPLIPSLLAGYRTQAQRKRRVINLLEIATPTAALRQLRAEYDAAFKRILAGRPRAVG